MHATFFRLCFFSYPFFRVKLLKNFFGPVFAQTGFYSNLFLVPKKDGGQRPVINLKALNNFVNKEHFKMGGIHTLKDLLKREDWLAI